MIEKCGNVHGVFKYAHAQQTHGAPRVAVAVLFPVGDVHELLPGLGRIVCKADLPVRRGEILRQPAVFGKACFVRHEQDLISLCAAGVEALQTALPGGEKFLAAFVVRALDDRLAECEHRVAPLRRVHGDGRHGEIFVQMRAQLFKSVERHIDRGHGKLHPKIVQQQSAVAVACNKEKPAVFHSPAQPEQIRPPPPRPNRAQTAFELLFHRIPQRFLTAYHTTAAAQMQSGRTCKEPCGAVK